MRVQDFNCHHDLAPENGSFPMTIRQLPYGLRTKPTHRAIFEIRDDKVYVFAVRHLAQPDLTFLTSSLLPKCKRP